MIPDVTRSIVEVEDQSKESYVHYLDYSHGWNVGAYKEGSSPKEAWDTFVTLFSKKNDARLQLLETSYYL